MGSLLHACLAAEGQYLLYQVPGPDTGLEDLIEFIFNLPPVFKLHLGKLGKAEDGKNIILLKSWAMPPASDPISASIHMTVSRSSSFICFLPPIACAW